jgi:hypothetical protein
MFWWSCAVVQFIGAGVALAAGGVVWASAMLLGIAIMRPARRQPNLRIVEDLTRFIEFSACR